MKLKILALSGLILTSSALADPEIHYRASAENNFDKFEGQMYIEKNPSKKGYFWAYSLYSNKGQHTLYIGIQPRESLSKNLVIFSAFGKGVTSTHANCNNGADGGDGVSCRVLYPFEPQKKYKLFVEKINTTVSGDTLWRGLLHDVEANKDAIIGEYLTPASWEQLNRNLVHFTEWTRFNDKDPAKRDCVPAATFRVYNPIFFKDGKEFSSASTKARLTAGKDKCAIKHNTPNARLLPFDEGLIVDTGFLAP